MTFNEYKEYVKDVPVSDKLEFSYAGVFVRVGCLPLGLVSLGGDRKNIIKIPRMVRNKYGMKVPIRAISENVFFKNEDVTDIILPSGLTVLPKGAFDGCVNLRNITIPTSITRIGEFTFNGCDNLENIFYEGSYQEWKSLQIIHEYCEIECASSGRIKNQVISERVERIAGNNALLTCNTVHLHCNIDSLLEGFDMDSYHVNIAKTRITA